MQPAARTPSSILRKRANKENDPGRDGKRNKLRGRRVSFAPDDELHTMHLYQKDDRRHEEDMQLTEDLTAGLQPLTAQHPNLWGASGYQFSNVGQLSAAPHLSPLPASPLSMDLSNNSLEFPMLRGMAKPSAPHQESASADNQNFNAPLQHSSHYQPQPGGFGMDFTRNITSNVPALSTLVEEDEEAGMDMATGCTAVTDDAGDTVSMELTGHAHAAVAHSPDGPGLNLANVYQPSYAAAAASPPSPFVYGEMQRHGSMGIEDDTDQLKSKWGFKPGAEDTLDVSHGHRVMGDMTYNHVYHATTGEITKAIKAVQQDDVTGGILDPAGLRGALGPLPGPAQAAAPAAALPVGAAPVPQQAMAPARLLGAAAHSPEPALAAATAASMPRFNAGAMLHETPFPQPEMTIRLLEEDNQTEAWRQPLLLQSNINTGRVSVASNRLTQRRGAAEGTTNLLGGPTQGYTAQLLVDNTTKGALDHLMHKIPHLAAASSTGAAARERMLADATGASTSAAALRAAADRNVISAGHLADDGTANSFEFQLAHNQGHSGALLGEDVTLDDFQQPPELSLTALQPVLTSQQQGHPPMTPLQQQPTAAQLQPASALAQPFPGAAFALTPARGGYGQQLQAAASARSAPPITFQEFLQVVELRFLDDMRRRTSFINPVDLALEPAPCTLAEALDVVHIANARMSLYTRTIEGLAERVEVAQARILEAETALAKANPPVFGNVQVASPMDLDRIRDQMKLLKRVCRHRTMMAWKQMRIEFEQALSEEYRRCMQEIEQEMQTAKAHLDKAVDLEQAVNQAHVQVLQQVQQDHTDYKEAVTLRERQAFQRQRVAEMQEANAKREQQLQNAEAEYAGLQAQHDKAQLLRMELQRQLEQLKADAMIQDAPSKAGPAPLPAAAAAKLLEKQEQLEVMMGLQGLKLDATGLLTSKSWCITLRGQFKATVDMEPCGGMCRIGVTPLPSGFQSSAAKLMLPHIGTLYGAEQRVPVKALRHVLEDLQTQLAGASDLMEQLAAAMQRWPLLAQASVSNGQELELSFVNADAPVKLVVSVPLRGLRQMRTASPQVKGAVRLPTVGAQQLAAELSAVLQQLQSSPLYVLDVCCAVAKFILESTTLGQTVRPAGECEHSHIYENPLYA